MEKNEAEEVHKKRKWPLYGYLSRSFFWKIWKKNPKKSSKTVRNLV